MDELQRNQFIALKLNEGVKLNDIQRLLEEEHGLRMTYLELRMLVSELEVDWSKHAPPKPEPQADDVVSDEEGDIAELDEEFEDDEVAADETAAAGDVEVTVSKLARPDAAISGSYSCPSGARGEWIVDHYGRPGLIPAEGSPKPTQDEMRQFQMALMRKLQGGGI